MCCQCNAKWNATNGALRLCNCYILPSLLRYIFIYFFNYLLIHSFIHINIIYVALFFDTISTMMRKLHAHKTVRKSMFLSFGNCSIHIQCIDWPFTIRNMHPFRFDYVNKYHVAVTFFSNENYRNSEFDVKCCAHKLYFVYLVVLIFTFLNIVKHILNHISPT